MIKSYFVLIGYAAIIAILTLLVLEKKSLEMQLKECRQELNVKPFEAKWKEIMYDEEKEANFSFSDGNISF